MKCPVCQSEIQDNSLFCPNCGARILANQPSQPPTVNQPINLYGRPIVVNHQPDVYSRYIFVVSLVLMILGAIGWVVGVASSTTLASQITMATPYLSPNELSLYTRLLNLIRGENWLVLAGFASTLILMIFAVGLKRKTQYYSNPESVTKQVKMQLAASIAAVVIAVAFVIYEAVAINVMATIIAALGLDLATGPSALIMPGAKAALLIPSIIFSFKALATVSHNSKTI